MFTSLLGGRQQFTRHIIRYYRTPDILAKTKPARPIEPIQPKGAFQSGDGGLNAGSEVAQFSIYPKAFDHIQKPQSSLLGKHHNLDAIAFGGFQIILGGKAAVRRHLPRWSVKKIDLPLEQGGVYHCIRRITLFNQTIKD